MATVAAAVGAGAVEPALEGPGVGRRRADALGRRRRAGRRRAAAVVAVEPALLLHRVHVVGSH